MQISYLVTLFTSLLVWLCDANAILSVFSSNLLLKGWFKKTIAIFINEIFVLIFMIRKIFAFLLLALVVALAVTVSQKQDEKIVYNRFYLCNVEDENFGFPDIYAYKDIFYLPKSESKQYVHTEQFVYQKNMTGEGWLVKSQFGGNQSSYSLIKEHVYSDATKCRRIDQLPPVFQEFRISHGIILLMRDAEHYIKD